MFFKVSFKNLKDGQSHTLQANDEHDKRQWVTCIKSLLKDAGSSSEGETTTHVDPEVRKAFDWDCAQQKGLFSAPSAQPIEKLFRDFAESISLIA